MLVVETNYANGIPQTTVAGWAPAGVGVHWSAGGPGRAGWEATIRHLVNTRWTVNASYHGGFWCEHDAAHRACRTIIQWIVPTTKAAHSIAPSRVFVLNPNKPRLRQETRFVEVRRILGAKAFDPNAGCIAIAYAGMPADLARDRACPVFMGDVRNLARQLVAHPATVDRPHFGHGWIQPITRYEMDLPEDFVALLYQEPASTPAEDTDMKLPDIEYVPQNWVVTREGGAPLYRQPDLTEPTGTFIPKGGKVFSAFEISPGVRQVVIPIGGDVERGLFMNRWHADAMEPKPRDAELRAGIAAVIAARMAGQAVPVEGFTGPQLKAAEDNAFADGKERSIAAYTVGGTAAAKAVTR